jgi:hypothetical protein
MRTSTVVAAALLASGLAVGCMTKPEVGIGRAEGPRVEVVQTGPGAHPQVPVAMPPPGQTIEVRARPDAVTFVEAPSLVPFEADVYVVENYDAPVYYVDGRYWRLRGGLWHSAPSWDAPWVQVQIGVVPSRIVLRDHHPYVHYRAPPGVRVLRDPHPRERALPSRSPEPKAQGREPPPPVVEPRTRSD